MASWKSNSYEGRYLQLTITEKVDVAKNQSTLYWTLTSVGGSSLYYSIAATSVKINGTEVYSKGATDWSSKVFPAAKGSKNGQLVVSHNADGSKKIQVDFQTRVWYSDAVNYGSEMTLTKIDRSSPTINLVVSNITANSLQISANSNVACDRWRYSVDGGKTYTQFSTQSGTSVSTTISSLSPNTTYNIKVEGRRKTNQVCGYSAVKSAKTLGAASFQSVDNFSADASTVKINAKILVYDSSFKNVVKLCNGDTELLTLDAGTAYTAGSSTKTYTLTSSQRTTILKDMSKTKTKSYNLIIWSYKDNSLIASNKIVVTALTSADLSAPKAGTITWYDLFYRVGHQYTEAETVLLQNISTLCFYTSGFELKNGATYDHSFIQIGNETFDMYRNDVNGNGLLPQGKISIPGGTYKVVYTCFDSRGYSCSITSEMTIKSYERPSFQTIALKRKDMVGEEVKLEISCKFYSLPVNGTNKNGINTFKYRYQEKSADSWSAWKSLSNCGKITYSSDRLDFLADVGFEKLSSSKDYLFQIAICDDVCHSLIGYDGGATEDNVTTYEYKTLLKGTPGIAVRNEKGADGKYTGRALFGINNNNPQCPLDVNGIIQQNGLGVFGTVSTNLGESDLDDVVAQGIYWAPSYDKFEDLHYPSYYNTYSSGGRVLWGDWGIVEVFTDGGTVIQRFVSRDAPFRTYIRHRFNGVWSEWQNIWNVHRTTLKVANNFSINRAYCTLQGSMVNVYANITSANKLTAKSNYDIASFAEENVIPSSPVATVGILSNGSGASGTFGTCSAWYTTTNNVNKFRVTPHLDLPAGGTIEFNLVWDIYADWQ